MIGPQLCLAELWQLSIVPPLWDAQARGWFDLHHFLDFSNLMGSILLCVVCGTVIAAVSTKDPDQRAPHALIKGVLWESY